MKRYADFLKQKGIQVHYIDAHSKCADIRDLLPQLREEGINSIHTVDVIDDWLSSRLSEGCKKLNIELHGYPSPLFLNSKENLELFFRTDKKKYHQTSFYTDQRKKRNFLLNPDGSPEGGKWTFDTENRKKYPVKKVPPSIHYPNMNPYVKEAKHYVAQYFPNNLGSLREMALYPIDYESTQQWFAQFLEYRFLEFGKYEDAIVSENSILHHSVLTPVSYTHLTLPTKA